MNLADADERLASLYTELVRQAIDRRRPWTQTEALTFIRAAYGRGYSDGLGQYDDHEPVSLDELRPVIAEAAARLPVL